MQIGLHELLIQVNFVESPGTWWVRDDIHIVQAGDLWKATISCDAITTIQAGLTFLCHRK